MSFEPLTDSTLSNVFSSLYKTYKHNFHKFPYIQEMSYEKFGQTDLQVSRLGLGTSQLALCYGTKAEKEGIETVIEAVKCGINYIDTAPYYGQGKAEIVLGKALKKIPRSTYYLATKIGRYGSEPHNMFDFSAEATMKGFEDSLRRLGLDYVDVLQVHDVEFAASTDIIIEETLPVLQKLKDSGKVKYIGITGYKLSVLKEIVEKSKVKIDMVLSYCRHTMFNKDLRDYMPFFEERELGIVNAALMGMGLLTNNGPPDWHTAHPDLKLACKKAAEYCKERDTDIAKLAVFNGIGIAGVHVHLIGMQCLDLLKKNLSAMNDGVTMEEEMIERKLPEKFFSDLPSTHWEDVEVAEYWKNVKKLQVKE